jgi:hypothetical protein
MIMCYCLHFLKSLRVACSSCIVSSCFENMETVSHAGLNIELSPLLGKSCDLWSVGKYQLKVP